MKRIIALLCLVLVASTGYPQPVTGALTVSGHVFVDQNGNGIRDGNESGVAGVAVSDQVNVVQTDAAGAYQLRGLRGYGFVFISLPSGYKPSKLFWQKVPAVETNVQMDFAIEKIPDLKEFSFIQASDTHVSEKTIDRMQKFRAIVDSMKPDFVIITGDLVRDALRVSETEATGYFELYRDQIKQMTIPVWNVPGNHELFGIERQTSLVNSKNPLYGRNMYHHYFGPDYYSFNFGGIHFIGLNSVDFEDLWYFGHVDSIQVEWMKKDLSMIPPNTPVVTFNHIPFYSGGLSIQNFKEFGFDRTVELEKGNLQYRHVVSNAHEVISILRHYNFLLALAGHHHSSQQFTLNITGQPLRFEQTAAVIGPLEDGDFQFPSGVTLYQVKNGTISKGIFIPLDKK
jgi:predicted MPP superfamily phosphohydrolase